MDFETRSFDETEGLAHITLNRPQVCNTLDATMSIELHKAMLNFDEIPQVRAVLLEDE